MPNLETRWAWLFDEDCTERIHAEIRDSLSDLMVLWTTAGGRSVHRMYTVDQEECWVTLTNSLRTHKRSYELIWLDDKEILLMESFSDGKDLPRHRSRWHGYTGDISYGYSPAIIWEQSYWGDFRTPDVVEVRNSYGDRMRIIIPI